MNAIFIGRVASIQTAPATSLHADSEESGDGIGCGSVVTFEVTRWYEGKKGTQAHVRECILMCPSYKPFEVGKQYLVYAEGRPLGAVLGCARSRELAHSNKRQAHEMRQLGSAWYRLWARVWP